MLDLREKDRDRICRIAEECFTEPIEIWAYGSRVNGESHDASDLDLVVRGRDLEPVKNDALYNFKEALRDSTIPILVQVLDWASIPETFRRDILQNEHEALFTSL